MTRPECNTSKTHRPRARLTAAGTALLALALLVVASSAHAAYEQVGNFAGTPGELQLAEGGSASWPEAVQLSGISGMAVNYTGAGGVPRGTIYAATKGEARVARYNPNGSFSEAWTFAGSPPSERCGPDGESSHPVCKGQEDQPSDTLNKVDVDVDQSTGDVYVYDGELSGPGENLIHVYSPDGSKLLAEFGEPAAFQEATAASPGKLHQTGERLGRGIAVNGAGDVYVFDENDFDNHYRRLMEFAPLSTGDYEHYAYAGQGHDIAAGFLTETLQAAQPVIDATGDLYVVSEEEIIFKIDPDQPLAHPLCEFKYPRAGISAVTVDPETGEVFFYSFKEHETIHQLSADCNAEGKFVETSAVHFSPARSEIGGLAFDPDRAFEAGRPPGVLYAGSANGNGGKHEGKYPEARVESALGYVFSRPREEVAPVVVAESVAHVTATTAELSAQVNPEGSATRYIFEYETEAEYLANGPAERFAGAIQAPVGGASVGEGNEAVVRAAALGGLEPDTMYRFRVLASSHCSVADPEKVCQSAGDAQTFRSFPVEASGLQDHRVYELVSPAQKHGGQVLPADPGIESCRYGGCKPGRLFSHFPLQSAPGGDAIVYEGTPFESEAGQVHGDEYIARRDPTTGWQSVNLTPTQLGLSAEGFTAFDTALEKGVLLQEEGPALSPEAPAGGYADLYSQSPGDPVAFTPFVTTEPSHRVASGTSKFEIHYGGESADGSRVFFAANDALTGGTSFAPQAQDGGAAEFNLYEWHEGQLALVNVLPGNAVTQPGAVFGTSSAHAISDDGSKVFWSSEETGHVYARVDGRETLEVPGPATCKHSEPESQRVCFLAASAGGARVLLSNGLIDELNEAGSAYEPAIDLTAGAGSGHEGGFQGILGQSEDLSHVYFVDTAVLSGEEANENCQEVGGKGVCEKAEAGKDNLYAWTQEGGTRFVVRLQNTDNGDGDLGSDWAAVPSARTAEASPQGRYLAFLSGVRLTGYDNTGPCEEISGTSTFNQTPCSEAFVYDAVTGKLACASCNPSNVRPLGRTVLRLLYGSPSYLPQSRYLTDGGRLFFDSEDSLVPADTNRGVEDVYEYEPGGVGTCEREGGCVSLISSGTGASDSNFLAIDEGGANVFFTTRDRLVSRDKDELIDLYDARENEGIASETEAAENECQGETCQPAISTPNGGVPASSVFSGPGDLVPVLAGVVEPKKKTVVQTRAQKLSSALKVCHRLGKAKRKRCEATARKRYGTKAKAIKSVQANGKGGK